jgi:Raf kinase inhibitor-like YbhB/YbcL family protein
MPLTLSSSAFAEGAKIPERYTRDGKNVSPPLKWSGVPDGTRSFLLVVQDPDAPSGTFGHWAVFNMSPDTQELSEAEGGKPGPNALRQARNDFGNAYYDGQPPVGHGVHHYHFQLAALDTPTLRSRQALASSVSGRKRKKICSSKQNSSEHTSGFDELHATDGRNLDRVAVLA